MAAYAADHLDVELLPWQLQVAERILEYDADGLWCWPRALVLVPRQSGKSTLLRALCEWRASNMGAVLSTSAKLQTVAHMMRGSQLRYRDQPGFNVKLQKDQPELNWPGAGVMAGRWIGQAANDNLGRGFSADLAVVDEVQDVKVEAMESLAPALVEARNPLVLAFGTAARGPSELLNRMRDAGMRGDGVLHIEWSAPVDLPYDAEETWRVASPRWSPERLRFLRGEVKVQAEVAIRSEYLCQPQVGGSEPWLNLADWDAARVEGLVVPARPQVAAVEDSQSGASLALAWVDGDGRICVTGERVGSLVEAFDRAGSAGRVLCGVSLRNDPLARSVGARPAGTRETASGLPNLRRLLPDGLRWSGEELDGQVRGTDIRVGPAGLSVPPGAVSGVLRCAAWAVQECRNKTEPVLV